MDSPETWRWIWVAAALVFSLGEMSTAGSFFFLPFAVGAVIAAVLAFLDVGVAGEWLGFVVVAGLGAAVMWPLGRRLDRRMPTADGSPGATRWIGRSATVIAEIPAGVHATGMIRLEREEWRAESLDGSPIEAGAVVRVVRVDGTRAVVERVQASVDRDQPR